MVKSTSSSICQVDRRPLSRTMGLGMDQDTIVLSWIASGSAISVSVLCFFQFAQTVSQ